MDIGEEKQYILIGCATGEAAASVRLRYSSSIGMNFSTSA